MFFRNKDETLRNRPFSISEGPVTDFADNFKASLQNQSVAHSFIAEAEAKQQVLQPILDEIQNKTGKKFNNFIGSAKNLPIILKGINRHIKNSAELNAIYPNGITVEEISHRARELGIEADETNKDVSSRYMGNGINWGQLAGSAYGETADLLENPFTAVPMILVGTTVNGFKIANVLRTMMVEGLIEGGLTLATRPGVKKWRNQLGLSYTWKDALSETGQATIAGAILGLPLHLTVAGAKQIFKGKQSTENYTSEEIQSAMQKVEDEINDIESNPYDTPDNSLHIENMDNSTKQILEEGTPKENVEPIEKKIKIKEIKKPADNIKNNLFNVEELDPDELSFDAESFQFKTEMQDDRGVTNKLRNTKKWEPASRGLIVVYEDVNGKKFIVDGHQRLGLAQRIKKQRDGQDPKLLAHVYREQDGWTKDELLVKGAVKNIGEGTGSITDASKIFRVDKSQMDKLNLTDSLVRYGNGIANLDDDMYRLAVSGTIADENMVKYMGLVGEIVEDKTKHRPIIELLMKEAKPETLFQAEGIIRQADKIGFSKEKQETLFGPDITSLFVPRVKILEASIKSLKKRKGVFSTININSKNIEKEGNQLNKEANIRKEQIDAEAIEILKRLANKKGFLSDQLTAQARILADDKTKNRQVIQSFTESVVEAVKRGDFRREDVGEVGNVINPKAEVPIIAREEPARFDVNELGDKGSKEQVASLENSITTEDAVTNLDDNTVIPFDITADTKGELNAVTKTVKEILEDNKQEDALVNRLRDCV